MNVAITLEHRFRRTPDGAVWTQVGFAYPFWTRYLAVFDRVRVVARVLDVPSVSGDWKRADGRDVEFRPVPYYVGPVQYLCRRQRVVRAARAAVEGADAVILRVGSQVGACIEPVIRRTGRPYAVEVVGDPWETFSPGAVRHPLRPFLRRWFSQQLRRQCANACAAAYVTESALQRRYPPAPRAFTTHYSSIELPDSACCPSPRTYVGAKPSWRLVTVGSLAQLYKSPDVMIDAVGLLSRGGRGVSLVIVGDGKHRLELEERARRQGLNGRVVFRGQLPAGDAVRAELDNADLFLLPSRTEGLPRALIEAMARALPCIGSAVGGIPELLPREDMVPPGDARALAEKIHDVLSDPERMSRMSARNLQRARDYRDSILGARRTAFYQRVREVTEQWIRCRAPGKPGSTLTANQ